MDGLKKKKKIEIRDIKLDATITKGWVLNLSEAIKPVNKVIHIKLFKKLEKRQKNTTFIKKLNYTLHVIYFMFLQQQTIALQKKYSLFLKDLKDLRDLTNLYNVTDFNAVFYNAPQDRVVLSNAVDNYKIVYEQMDLLYKTIELDIKLRTFKESVKKPPSRKLHNRPVIFSEIYNPSFANPPRQFSNPIRRPTKKTTLIPLRRATAPVRVVHKEIQPPPPPPPSIQIPTPAIQRPQSAIQRPQSAIQRPQSAIQRPQSAQERPAIIEKPLDKGHGTEPLPEKKKFSSHRIVNKPLKPRVSV